MNRELFVECFPFKGRTKWYTSPEEIQADIDTFIAFDDLRRAHQ